MRRFYEAVSAVRRGPGYGIELDGRPVRTPKKAILTLPTSALAEVVVQEWESQEGEIDLSAMPLCKLANTAIDRVAPMRDQVLESVAAYGASDFVCYYAVEPTELIQQQTKHWRPLRKWLDETFEIELVATSGIVQVEQDRSALERLLALVSEYDDLALTALHEFTTITGSVVIGLALSKGQIDRDAAWAAAMVDEIYQAELWGEDEEAKARRDRLYAEFSDALRFLELLRA